MSLGFVEGMWLHMRLSNRVGFQCSSHHPTLPPLRTPPRMISSHMRCYGKAAAKITHGSAKVALHDKNDTKMCYSVISFGTDLPSEAPPMPLTRVSNSSKKRQLQHTDFVVSQISCYEHSFEIDPSFYLFPHC